MIVINEHKEKCFADIYGKCELLIHKNCIGCNFYKPVGCMDWIRLERNGQIELLPPEEYEKENRL